MSLPALTSASETEILDLSFTGFIIQSESSLSEAELIGKLPEQYHSDGWTSEVIDEDDNIYYLQALKEDENFHSRAWDISYKLKESDSSIVEIDPVFVPTEESIIKEMEKNGLQAFGGGGESPENCPIPEEKRSQYTIDGLKLCKPIESDDFDWMNKFMRFREAWEFTGSRGESVIVGHPDSGYSHHPEILPNFLVDRAKNFVEKDEDGMDKYTGNNHGHGTSTASLIASPEGLQEYPLTTWQKKVFGNDRSGLPSVDGIAPGAKIISYRVMNGNVIRFNFTKLTKALKQAVKDDVGVVSISLGGPLPMPWLHRAIKKAVDSGLIVVAAAGNFIPEMVFKKFTVWPAQYKETVAVAASTSTGEVWEHSSKGRRVDMTVPGADIWSARTKLRKDEGRVMEVKRGSGTSFSTAYTAGAAALFLDYHGHDNLKSIYGANNVTTVFKYMLENHAHNTPKNWDNELYGPGILDVYKLVSSPLPDPAIFGIGTNGEVSSVDRMEVQDTVGYLDNFMDQFPKRSKYGMKKGLRKLFKLRNDEELNTAFAEVGYELNMIFAKDKKVQKEFEMTITSDFKTFIWRSRAFKRMLNRKKPSDKLKEVLSL